MFPLILMSGYLWSTVYIVQAMTLTRIVSVERTTAGLLRANFPFSSLLVGIVRKNNGANGTYQFAAAIHKSAVCALKKIVHREENGVTVIEGTFVDSPHKEKLLRPAASAIVSYVSSIAFWLSFTNQPLFIIQNNSRQWLSQEKNCRNAHENNPWILF